MNKDTGTITFIAGMLFGGIIGAAVALLVAPDDGEITRKKVKKVSNKLFKKGMQAFDQFQEEQLEPFLGKVTESASKARVDAEAKFNELKDDFVSRMEAKKAAKQTAEKVS